MSRITLPGSTSFFSDYRKVNGRNPSIITAAIAGYLDTTQRQKHDTRVVIIVSSKSNFMNSSLIPELLMTPPPHDVFGHFSREQRKSMAFAQIMMDYSDTMQFANRIYLGAIVLEPLTKFLEHLAVKTRYAGKVLTSVHSLFLGNNVEHWKLLGQIPSLTEIDVSGCNINDEFSFKKPFSYLENLPHLEVLNFSQLKGAARMSVINNPNQQPPPEPLFSLSFLPMRNRKTIKTLNLNRCYLLAPGSNGTQHDPTCALEGLKDFENLTDLDLSYPSVFDGDNDQLSTFLDENISGLIKMRKFVFGGMNRRHYMSNFDFLQNLTLLEHLELGTIYARSSNENISSKISSLLLDPLVNMKILKRLYLTSLDDVLIAPDFISTLSSMPFAPLLEEFTLETLSDVGFSTSDKDITNITKFSNLRSLRLETANFGRSSSAASKRASEFLTQLSNLGNLSRLELHPPASDVVRRLTRLSLETLTAFCEGPVSKSLTALEMSSFIFGGVDDTEENDEEQDEEEEENDQDEEGEEEEEEEENPPANRRECTLQLAKLKNLTSLVLSECGILKHQDIFEVVSQLVPTLRSIDIDRCFNIKKSTKRELVKEYHQKFPDLGVRITAKTVGYEYGEDSDDW